MESFDAYLNHLVNETKDEFSGFEKIRWVNPYESEKMILRLQKLRDKVEDTSLFKKTKPFYNHISNGCSLCGKGLWSCLFITGRCNASCFYCPSVQSDDEIPSSQGIDFPTPESYAEYINHFGFKGVAFSGGEPLLYPERVLAYLRRIREVCDKDIYIWMYTNGLLANEQIFRDLADAGLDEVRFDIGATKYNLDAIRFAKDKIENITIEIPSVPEEKDKIISLLPEMISAGVKNLNLHQLRLTKYNAHKLLKKKYTYIPAEKPIVLESELAALEIISYAKEKNINIGINYCSFYFKNRFQQAGFRNMVAKNLPSLNSNDITEKGYSRKIIENAIIYERPVLYDKEHNECAILDLKYKKYYTGSTLAKRINLSTSDLREDALNIIQSEPKTIPVTDELFEVWRHEYIEKGLREV